MTFFNLAYGALRMLAHAAVELVRPHACYFGGPGCFKTHDLVALERHYYIDHAGDRMDRCERTIR